MTSLNQNAWQKNTVTVETVFRAGGSGSCWGYDDSLVNFAPNRRYYFVSMITQTDTLLGFIQLSTGGYIYDYAIEGSTIVHIATSTTDLTANSPSISPNPFTNQINVGTDKAVEYQVTDYTGRVLLSGKTERSISTEMLSSGSYLLLLKNEELYSVKKMVK